MESHFQPSCSVTLVGCKYNLGRLPNFRSFFLAYDTLCGRVGFVIRLHLLFGEVRSVTTVLKVVEEVQEGLQEIEGE